MSLPWHYFLLIGLLGLAAAPASASVKVGAPAPAFEARTMDGQAQSLASLRGKTVILTFWATWCAPCREEMAAFEAYYERHHAEGLEIIAVNQDDPDSLDKVKTVMAAFRFPAALDRQVKRDRYGRVSELPVSIVIDREGIVRADSRQGNWVFDAQRLDQIVTPLLTR